MENKEFERKHKENKPVIAICYDFDKTLSPDDMQAQGFIQSIGYDVGDFWRESNKLAANNDMDQNLAYMLMMTQEAEGNVIIKEKSLNDYGAKIGLFPGVETWFERIRKYGQKKGVIIEHYIISSGLKEMIEGTSIAKSGAFEKIYASSFYYNNRGVAAWPAQVVNFTNKTQFLFRIEKGVLDINDPGVNEHFEPEDIRVPFRNMIYIGDSDTDIPCMSLINARGGYSIGVYNANTADKTKVFKMMKDARIKYFAPTDYSDGSELDRIVKAIIDRTVDNELLESMYYNFKKESSDFYGGANDAAQVRGARINALDESCNFATTHMEIETLSHFKNEFSEEDINRLIEIALSNSQVRYILKDWDVKEFYADIISKLQERTEDAKSVLDIINS